MPVSGPVLGHTVAKSCLGGEVAERQTGEEASWHGGGLHGHVQAGRRRDGAAQQRFGPRVARRFPLFVETLPALPEERLWARGLHQAQRLRARADARVAAPRNFSRSASHVSAQHCPRSSIYNVK